MAEKQIWRLLTANNLSTPTKLIESSTLLRDKKTQRFREVAIETNSLHLYE